MSTPHHLVGQQAQPRLQVDYASGTDLPAMLASPDVLAVFGFGADAPVHADPRYLRVPLQPHGHAPLEVWRADTGIDCGRDGDIAWASNGALSFGVIEVEETGGDIVQAATYAYQRLTGFIRASATPHLLRIWNYLDAITLGDGDNERYRQFCIGRARGLDAFQMEQLPAATAIGRRDGVRTLQVYWLAGRSAGTPLENPRQVSAYRYPRQYGPQPPSFARAMLPPADAHMPLLLSGTASVVGHATAHEGQVLAQLQETIHNLDSLITAARARQSQLPAHLDASSRLKVYVRNAADLDMVTHALDARFGSAIPRLVLHGIICRNGLAVEIDGVHG